MGEKLQVDNGTIEIEFDIFENGATLSSISQAEKDVEFGLQPRPQDDHPLWELEFHDESGEMVFIDSLSNSEFSYTVNDDLGEESITLCWEEISLDFLGQTRGHVDVTIEVDLSKKDSFAYWEAHIEIRGSDITLWRFTFPNYHNIQRVGADRVDDKLLLPEGWGTYIQRPTDDDKELTNWDKENYPSATWPMQFLSFENDDRGVYVGFHDPEARPKGMSIDSEERTQMLSFSADHYPEGMTEEQSSFELGYEVVTGIYEGDWYDAGQIYRDWALDEATWTAEGPVAERDDIPEWFKEICLWWAPGFSEVVPWSSESFVGFEETVTLLRELQDRFSVPTGVHWYNWHRNVFDTDHPDYFPPKEGFEHAVGEVQDAGLHVMPYITVRSWDPNGDVWEDRDLGAGAAKRASPRYNPRTRSHYVETFTNPQLLSAMCPASELFQDVTKDIVKELREGIGVHAVYLDQMAADNPPLCFDPTHDHPQGGGTYGVSGFQDLLTDLIDANDPDNNSVGFTTECNAEPYMGGISGYLMWHAARSEQVPLFSSVYGDYCITFGREFFEDDVTKNPDVFTSKMAQLFTYGAQLGWITRTTGRALLSADYSTAANYLQELATALEEASEYMITGRRLRNLQTQSTLQITQLTWDMQNHGKWDVEVPFLMSSVWSAPSKKGVAISLTNWGDETQSCIYQLATEHLSQIDGDEYAVQTLTNTDGDIGIDPEEDRIEATLPGKSAEVIKIIPK